MSLQLSVVDRAMLDGDRGPGVALAMRVLVGVAESVEASHLLDVTAAHIDGCLYHGQAGLDFAQALVDGGAAVSVPTTLNVSSLDLLHPELVRLDGSVREKARSLMQAYQQLGCSPTWTCAPYQTPARPGPGQQIAWGESNAVVFANSVLGARTERYGDFLDICAAVTGRAPAVGLHLDEGRRPTIAFSVHAISDRLDEDAVFALLGFEIGRRAGTGVPLIVGLPDGTTEDQLKALGATAASSGSVAMFHAVGITPEAPETVPDGLDLVEIEPSMLAEAQRRLSTTSSDRVDAVSLGTPHYSRAELDRLVDLLDGRRCRIPLYVSAGRGTLDNWEADKRERVEGTGATFVTDTCTYITPVLDPGARVVMTDSGKWAYYAPANLGVDVVYGSTAECVEAALTGRIQERP